MSTLNDLMNKRGAAQPAKATPEPIEAEANRLPEGRLPEGVKLDFIPPREVSYTTLPLSPFDGIEVEAVVAGALMRVRFRAGVTPTEAITALRAHDANAKFRDDFPKGGFGGGGKRETKTARVLVLNVDVRDSGKFVSMTARDGADDLNIAVGKKGLEEWLPKLEALGKLSERNLGKIRAAFDAKKSATIILSENEQFGAAYWKTEDGKAFLEEMKAEAPEIPAEVAE